MLDVFDNINVDVAIADSNTLQIVFKGLLEVTKYINAHTLARHVRICIHNEKMFVDMTDDTRGQIDNVLTMLKKFYSFRNQVFLDLNLSNCDCYAVNISCKCYNFYNMKIYPPYKNRLFSKIIFPTSLGQKKINLVSVERVLLFFQ